MKEIQLTKNLVTLVDDCDYDFLNQWRWLASRSRKSDNYYAIRTVYNGKKKINTKMHRVILDAKDGDVVDHINMNCLDNRRCNLRLCTYSQNAKNRRKQINNKSGIKGVHLHQNKWLAQIKNNGKKIYLGIFDEKLDAHNAYVEACKKYHKEFGNYEI